MFRIVQSCAMNAKSRITLKLPNGMVTLLEMGKTNLSRLGLLKKNTLKLQKIINFHTFCNDATCLCIFCIHVKELPDDFASAHLY